MSKDGKACFKCDPNVLDNFRRLVAQKYGRLYGVLNVEFTEALRQRSQTLQKELEFKEKGEEPDADT